MENDENTTYGAGGGVKSNVDTLNKMVYGSV